MANSIYELYGEIWGTQEAGVVNTLQRSLSPRPSTMLYDYLDTFALTAEQTVLDIGCRDAKHAIELVKRFGCRAEAIDPIALHTERAAAKVADAGLAASITVRTGSIEAIPLADGAVDHIWCRDVLNHVDLAQGLGECFRVLKPGGLMLVYQTFGTALMEPQEAARIYRAMAIVPQNMAQSYFEASAAAGFAIVKQEQIGPEWREQQIEAGEQQMLQDLLYLARLQRGKDAFIAQHGAACYETSYADCAWGVYQMLGKLNPMVYILQKPHS